MIILILQVKWFWKLPKGTQLVWGGTGFMPRRLQSLLSSCCSGGLLGGATALNPVYAVPSTVPGGQEARSGWQPLLLLTDVVVHLLSSRTEVLCGGRHAWLGVTLVAVPRVRPFSHILLTSCCAFLSLSSSCLSAALL